MGFQVGREHVGRGCRAGDVEGYRVNRGPGSHRAFTRGVPSDRWGGYSTSLEGSGSG